MSNKRGLWFLILGLSLGLGGVASSLAGEVQIGTDGSSGNTVISTQGRSPDLILPVGTGAERICWFDGHQFSKGARIKAGDAWLECTRENDYETNGALSWRQVGEVPSSPSRGKVQVN